MSSRIRVLAEIFLPTLALFLIHRLRIAFDPMGSDIDPVMHFLGGVSIAWMVWRGYIYARAHQQFPLLPKWFFVLSGIAIVALVGVLWEFYEYVVFIWIDPSYDIRLPDTMQDLLLDLCGGSLLTGIVVWIERGGARGRKR